MAKIPFDKFGGKGGNDFIAAALRADEPDQDAHEPEQRATDDPDFRETEQQYLEAKPEPEERYQGRYRDGYYIVIDTTTGEVVPSPANHYKRYRDGYLWVDAAVSAARDLNEGA